MRIAITTLSFARYDKTAIKLLEQAGIEYIINETGHVLNEEELIQILDGCAGIIIGSESLTKKVIDACPHLKVISRCGKNIDKIDLTYIKRKDIALFNTPKGYALAVAELTVGLILSLLRHIPHQDREVRTGIWRKRVGNLLQGKRVGIIGLGYVGSAVADLLTNLGVEISYTDPNVHVKTFPKLELDELIDWSNIITLHCSKPEKSTPLLDLGRLSLMHPGSYLINVAQGGLVDEKALFGLLTAGHLAGAALDVFTKEPYDGILKDMDNIILTPHIGTYAKEARIIMENDAVKNIIAFFKK